MNPEQRAGAVCMFGFRGSSLSDPDTSTDIEELKAIAPRGVILFDHDLAGNHARNIQSPKQLTKLIGDLRKELGADLVIAIDQEGGHVARLDEHNGFLPTMSALDFAVLKEIDQIQYADRQAKQLRDLGIDLNFAPCVDLDVAPGSPIIAGKERAFGNGIEEVACCAHILIDAHHRAGVGCCIKHFPGHGSALLDSHHGVCDVTTTHTQDELAIFSRLINTYQNQIAVMSGHLIDKEIDPEFPASISEQHTTDNLRGVIGFDGVVITDSLDMRAIQDHFGEEQAGVLAINAGADLVLNGLNAPGYREPGSATRIVKAIQSNIHKDRLAVSCDRLDQFFGM